MMGTYSLGLFFGPGLPLTLGTPSAVNAAEPLFIPFFLTPSVGGGIDEGGSGLPAAGSVLVESELLGPSAAGTEPAVSMADVDSLVVDSSLISFLTSSEANLRSFSGDNFKVMI